MREMNHVPSKQLAQPQIYILMPVYNRKQITGKCLAQLKLQRYSNFKIILIDDGSTDGTADLVRLEFPESVVIRGNGNLWWGGSLHRGYEWLRDHENLNDADIVMTLNDDTYFESDYLEKAVEFLQKNQKIALGSTCFSQQTKNILDAGVFVDWSRYSFLVSHTGENINCLSTRGLFLRWGDFRSLRGFYPTLLPHYGSDYEFTIRAARKGLRLVVDPQVKLWVDEDATGLHGDVKRLNFKKMIKGYFSKRAVLNPIYLSSFILLSCPWIWIPRNLAYIWLRAGFHLSRSFLKSLINS